MKIAQIAPLYESVPPKSYGGTERVVSYLTEELVRQGHDVTLYASGDSQTRARLRAMCEKSLRLDESCQDPTACHVYMLEHVFQDAGEFDLIHNHVDYLAYPLARRSPVPVLTTLHGPLNTAELQPLYKEFGELPLISISRAQRNPLPWANWAGNVYHGLPDSEFQFNASPSREYLAFLGRVSPVKGVDTAIEIAKRTGRHLKIAAKIDKRDREYFEEKIQPLIDEEHIEFVGEIGGSDKESFLGNAEAVLFTIDWPEPFGLVMIEAMACGTPVIAMRRGSVPEVIQDGVSGFIIDDVDSGVVAVQKLGQLSRQMCRECFENRFTTARMAKNYAKIFQRAVHRPLRNVSN